MTDESSAPRTATGFNSIPWAYFALAYTVTWALWGAAYLAVRGRPVVVGSTEDLLAAAPPALLALVLLGVFGPFVSAFVLTWRNHGKGGTAALWKSGWTFKMPPAWWLVVLFLFPAGRVLSLIIAGAGVSFESFTHPLTLIGLTIFMYFLGGSFGEEYGWRGYALPRLLDGWSALNAEPDPGCVLGGVAPAALLHPRITPGADPVLAVGGERDGAGRSLHLGTRSRERHRLRRDRLPHYEQSLSEPVQTGPGRRRGLAESRWDRHDIDGPLGDRRGDRVEAETANRHGEST